MGDQRIDGIDGLGPDAFDRPDGRAVIQITLLAYTLGDTDKFLNHVPIHFQYIVQDFGDLADQAFAGGLITHGKISLPDDLGGLQHFS